MSVEPKLITFYNSIGWNNFFGNEGHIRAPANFKTTVPKPHYLL